MDAAVGRKRGRGETGPIEKPVLANRQRTGEGPVHGRANGRASPPEREVRNLANGHAGRGADESRPKPRAAHDARHRDISADRCAASSPCNRPGLFRTSLGIPGQLTGSHLTRLSCCRAATFEGNLLHHERCQFKANPDLGFLFFAVLTCLQSEPVSHGGQGPHEGEGHPATRTACASPAARGSAAGARPCPLAG